MTKNQTANTEPEIEMLAFPAPVQKHDLSYISDEFKGAYIEYVPFQGVDALALESRPSTEAITAFYELTEKYATEIVMPVKKKDGSVELRTLNKNQYRQVPYAYILKFCQSALQGELSENFTKQ